MCFNIEEFKRREASALEYSLKRFLQIHHKRHHIGTGVWWARHVHWT